MNLNLKDKIFIVTGGASGIGEAIVRTFAAEDGVPVILDRDRERGEALVARLKSAEKRAQFIQTDLCQESDCKNAVEKTLTTQGRIDGLINNAGINDGAGLSASIEDFQQSLNRNLMHYFAMLHFAKDALVASRGVVVNIGSKVATTGQGGTSGYAAAKGAIAALTREWAVDFLPHGVRVNEVVPAEVWTPLYEKWIATQPNPEEALRHIEKRIPLGARMTTPQEIADTVAFLASDRASHITGQRIYVDGGYTHLDRALKTE